MNVLILVTAYNEEKRIQKTIQSIKDEGWNNILVIDDGSKDNTYTIAKNMGVMVIKHLINRGQGAGIKTGIYISKEIKPDIIVFFDGDGQHFASDIKNIIQPILENKADVVIGSRFLKQNNIPFIRKIYNFIANIITFIFTRKYVSDTQTGFRAIRFNVVDKINIRSNGYAWCSEFITEIINKKLKYVEVPINVRYFDDWQVKGQNFFKGIKTVYQLFLQKIIKDG